MSTPVDLLTAYESAPSLVEAESALDRLGEVGASDIPLGDLYDELADRAERAVLVPLGAQIQALLHQGLKPPALPPGSRATSI